MQGSEVPVLISFKILTIYAHFANYKKFSCNFKKTIFFFHRKVKQAVTKFFHNTYLGMPSGSFQPLPVLLEPEFLSEGATGADQGIV